MTTLALRTAQLARRRIHKQIEGRASIEIVRIRIQGSRSFSFFSLSVLCLPGSPWSESMRHCDIAVTPTSSACLDVLLRTNY